MFVFFTSSRLPSRCIQSLIAQHVKYHSVHPILIIRWQNGRIRRKQLFTVARDIWRVICFCILFIEYLEFECQVLTVSYTLIVAFQLPTYQQCFVLYLSFYLVAWWHVAYGRFQSVYFSLIWAISDGRYGEISRFGTLL